jgi:hypothetical protein
MKEVECMSIIDLFIGYEGEYKPEEIDWGDSVGKEIIDSDKEVSHE